MTTGFPDWALPMAIVAQHMNKCTVVNKWVRCCSMYVIVKLIPSYNFCKTPNFFTLFTMTRWFYGVFNIWLKA